MEAPVGAAPLDHQPLRDRPSQRPPQVARAEAGEPLRQLGAAAEAVIGERDDRGDDLLGAGKGATGRQGGELKLGSWRCPGAWRRDIAGKNRGTGFDWDKSTYGPN